MRIKEYFKTITHLSNGTSLKVGTLEGEQANWIDHVIKNGFSVLLDVPISGKQFTFAAGSIIVAEYKLTKCVDRGFKMNEQTFKTIIRLSNGTSLKVGTLDSKQTGRIDQAIKEKDLSIMLDVPSSSKQFTFAAGSIISAEYKRIARGSK